MTNGLPRAGGALGMELGTHNPHLHSTEQFHGALILQGSRFCREVKSLTQDDTADQQERRDSNLGLETSSGHRLGPEGCGRGARPSQRGWELRQPLPAPEGRNEAAGPVFPLPIPLQDSATASGEERGGGCAHWRGLKSSHCSR